MYISLAAQVGEHHRMTRLKSCEASTKGSYLLQLKNPVHNRRAVVLAKAIHPKFFLDRQSSNLRMVWKISMEMSKSFVYSRGDLDPLNGHTVYK